MGTITLGNQYNFLRHVITLESIGYVTVVAGRGVVLGIGTCNRGPAMEPYGISGSAPGLIRKTYGTGKLVAALETAVAQGASVVYGMRVLGENYATASLDLDDSQTPGAPCGTLSATGPGAWGNIPRIKIDDGDLDHPKTEIINGNGTVGPYALDMDDIVESAFNRVRMAGNALDIVYTGSPDPGEVKMDKIVGSLTFASGEAPTGSDEIEVRYKHKSRKVTLQDESGLPIVYNNLSSLTMMAAKMRNDSLCNFDATVGATHLPATTEGYVNMAGGSEGDTISIDDWELAFNNFKEKLPATVYPSSIFSTESEVNEGQADIIALMDAYLWEMGNAKKPLQGFITMNPDLSTDEMKELKDGYVNLFMSLIGNGLDNNEMDLAPARAGQEAALGLGVSPADTDNSLKGVSGLLFQFTEAEREDLTFSGVEVLIKETGVHPYVGVTTDPSAATSDVNYPFRRTVDVRTICQCIVYVDNIVKAFLNKQRTLTNLLRMKTSIYLLMDKLLKASVLDTFSIDVTPNVPDHNAVDITLRIQPVGHIERVYTWVGVGYYNVTAVAA